MNQLVSIIIPVYNGEKFVEQAIKSALNQTYKNIEVIVVDDGSTDSTEQICKKYGKSIKYLKKKNGGVSTALNIGISKMNGDFFAWLSHDDLYIKDAIEKRIDFWIKKGSNKKQIVYTEFKLVNENCKRINRFVKKPVFINNIAGLRRNNINGCTILCHVSNIKGKLFSEKHRFLQDGMAWAQLVNEGCEFIALKHTTALSRVHKDQVTVKKNYLYEQDFKDYFNWFINPLFEKKDTKQLESIYLVMFLKKKRFNFYKDYLPLFDEYFRNNNHSFGFKVRLLAYKLLSFVF